jgi:hypothetical protein
VSLGLDKSLAMRCRKKVSDALSVRIQQFAGKATYFGADGSFTFIDAEDVKQLLELQVVSPKSTALP